MKASMLQCSDLIAGCVNFLQCNHTALLDLQQPSREFELMLWLFYRSGILHLRMQKILILKMLLLYINTFMYTYICIYLHIFQPTARQFSLGVLGQSWCFQDYFKGMLMLSCATEWRSCLVNRV